MFENMKELMEAGAALVGVLTTLLGVAMGLYVKVKKGEAKLQDYLDVLPAVVEVLIEEHKKGSFKEISEGVAAGLAMIVSMNGGKPLPKSIQSVVVNRITNRLSLAVNK